MAAVLGAADFLATPIKAEGGGDGDGGSAKSKEGEGVFHTPAQQRGMIPTSAPELRTLGNEALQEGNLVKACHMYTMAIDSLSRGLKADNGVASAADLYALNVESGGELAKLLSNRSLAHLKQGDAAAAVEDADACVKADMTVEKGHMRLVVALEALAVPLEQQLQACEAGLQAVPQASLLHARKKRLLKAIASLPKTKDATPTDRAPEESAIEATRRVADDLADPRRAMAATDLGSALAVGAFGLSKDLAEAERYLRIGIDGGDVSAQRNLGLMLLDVEGRFDDAMAQLSGAAQAGDEQAAGKIVELQQSAKVQQEEARAMLERMANSGDERAIAMLKEFNATVSG